MSDITIPPKLFSLMANVVEQFERNDEYGIEGYDLSVVSLHDIERGFAITVSFQRSA